MSKLLTLSLACMLVACGGPPETAQAGSVLSGQTPARAADLSVSELQAATASGLPVLDVRTPEEFAEGHVPGAINIPLQELQARSAELAALKDREFAVICAVGGRSSSATGLLHRQGYSGARNVAGGTQAWEAAGYPLE